MFAPIPETAWWPRYWALVSVLVSACDRDIEDLVGEPRVAIVEQYLAQNAKNVEHRVETLIERAKQRVSLRNSGSLTTKQQAELSDQRDLSAGLSYSEFVECPACGDQGILEGDTVVAAEMRYDHVSENDYDFWADLDVAVDRFSCNNCRLVLDGYDLLEKAGLPPSISAVDDNPDYPEPDYGND